MGFIKTIVEALTYHCNLFRCPQIPLDIHNCRNLWCLCRLPRRHKDWPDVCIQAINQLDCIHRYLLFRYEMEFTIERIHIFEPLLRRRHKVSSYVVFNNVWLGFCWYRLCQGDILLRVHNSSENTLSGCINRTTPFERM